MNFHILNLQHNNHYYMKHVFSYYDNKEVQMIDMRFFRGNLASYVTGNKFDDVLILYGCSGFATEEKRF